MKKEKRSGIYSIENIENGKKYIGQTSNLEKRKKTHFRNLKGGYHPNTHLQFSFNKYGNNKFIFKTLIYCEIFELEKYEQFFVDITPVHLLYNKCLECVASRKGVPVSKETRKKLSIANTGKTRSLNIRRKMSKSRMGEGNNFYGKKHSIKSKDKMSKAHKNLSEETRKKMREAQLGKSHSEETKNKISKATFGQNNPMYGKHHSEETRIKIRNNAPNRKLNEKQVEEIIRKLLMGSKLKELAEKYNVSFQTISKIKNNKSWKSVNKKIKEEIK